MADRASWPTLHPRPLGRAAALEEAPAGDIVGALGTIKADQQPSRRSWAGRLVALLAIMGPGLVVMVGDNDAGGVATYAQAGQNYGTSLLWTLPLLVVVLMVAQEMVVRLGAVTGVGHARLIKERFGAAWAWFSVVDLLVLNFATLVTEFIGVSLSLSYFGASPAVSVPIAAVGLVAMTVTGSFRRWERFMYVLIGASLVEFPLALLCHPKWAAVGRGLVVPGVAGGLSSTAVLFVIAIVGTTVAPWQLFFQQSNVVDKRITPRWANYERADTFVGAVLTNVAAAAIMIAAAFAFAGTKEAGQFTNALGVAQGLEHLVSPVAGALFAVLLLDASIIGAAAVTLSISYAVGDILGVRHSLHRSWREARGFYGAFAAAVGIGAGVVLVPGAPLGLITEAVQALAGVLLPSAMVFLLLLCNDRAVLGPWVNPAWLNALASVIVGVLVALSLLLMVTTAFPTVNVTAVLGVLGGLLVLGLIAGGLAAARARPSKPPLDRESRYRWAMPALALLDPPPRSRVRQGALVLLRVYVLLGACLLAAKTVLVALHG